MIALLSLRNLRHLRINLAHPAIGRASMRDRGSVAERALALVVGVFLLQQPPCHPLDFAGLPAPLGRRRGEAEGVLALLQLGGRRGMLYAVPDFRIARRRLV